MTAWLLAIAMVIAMIRRVEVYTAFTAGAREGMETAMRILPGLAAISVALRMLEASGLMHALCGALAPVAAWLGLPEGVMPLLLLRPLSGSASLGMLADILRQYGPDSRTGLVASAMMGSGETVLYTCALYLAAAGVKTRRKANRRSYSLPAARGSSPRRRAAPRPRCSRSSWRPSRRKPASPSTATCASTSR